MHKKIFRHALLVTAFAALSACTSTPPVAKADASARLAAASGSEVSGTARFYRTPGGVRIEAELVGLTPGEHGFHIHEVGDCSAPDASSAKGHFNPLSQSHGSHEGEHHAGDMVNLVADGNGKATYTRELPGLTLDNRNLGILGRALVVHASPDDYKSQPAGNSGKRIACGVILAE